MVAVSATKSLMRDAPLADAFGKQDRQPRLDAGDAVRYPRKLCVPCRPACPPGHRSGTGNDRTRTARTCRSLCRASRPPGGLVARRRRADEFGALPVQPVQVLSRQHQILRAGLANTFRPRLRALAISSIASPFETCRTRSAHRRVRPARWRDASPRARPVRSRRGVMNSAQVAARSARRSGSGWRLRSRSGPSPARRCARGHQRRRISMVGEPQALIGHEHLQRSVAILDEGREFLAKHLRRGVGDDQVEADTLQKQLSVGRPMVGRAPPASSGPSAEGRTAGSSCCRRTGPISCRSRNRPP